MTIFSSRKRVAAIGALTAITLVGGSVAYGYWTAGGSGTGSASTGTSQNFTVLVGSATGATSLAPGKGTQTFEITVTNPTGSGVQRLNDVAVSVAEDGGAAFVIDGGLNPDCTDADFAVSTITESGASSALPVDLAENEAWTGTVTVEMNPLTTNQDACKSLAAVPLYALAS